MTERAHITLVVDRSGSMGRTKRDAEGGITAFLDEQRKIDSVDVTVSLIQFDDRYEHVYGPTKLAHVPTFEILPRGNTRLLDAIGHAIADTQGWVDEAVEKVVIVIMTDGEENDSREHTMDSVSKLIDDAKSRDIEFVFLAGTLEAARMSRASGLRGQTMTFDPGVSGQMATAYATGAVNTRSFLSGQSTNVMMPDDVGQVDDDAP